MTKLIGVFFIIVAVWVGWKIFAYYGQVAEQNEAAQKAAVGADIKPDQLPGLPSQLNSSLDYAQKNGAAGLRDWLKAYGAQVQDPRKAWLEMDYCLAVRRDDPNEARQIFKAVKERTATNSPVYPRIRQLEKSFE